MRTNKAASAVRFVRTRAPVWALRLRYGLHTRYGQNAISRRKFRAQRPLLTPVQRRVVEDLEAHGVASVPLTELLDIASKLWSQLSAIVDAFARSDRVADAIHSYRTTVESPTRASDAYLVKLWPEAPAFSANHPLLRIGLASEVLDVVNFYLGLWSKLIYTDVWHSIPIDIGRRIGSQRWHRDPEDRSLVKAYLYFSDVHELAGPMEYVPGSAAAGMGPYRQLWPWKPRGDRYPTEEAMDRAVPGAARMLCTGQAGTLIFCDTDGFHRGGIATTGVRLLATWTYVPPAGMLTLAPRRFVVQDLEREGAWLSAAARFALK